MTKAKPEKEPEKNPKDAFLEALEAKKHRASASAKEGPKAGNTAATKHGPDAARRVRQRRMGSS